ncbi:MAG: hypothetical protein RhofKO_16620 [Rhodothermales bacterium]
MQHDLWDEHQWERFLAARDKRLERYTEWMYTFMAQHPPPHRTHRDAYRRWRSQLLDFLRQQGWSPAEAPLSFLYDDDEREAHHPDPFAHLDDEPDIPTEAIYYTVHTTIDGLLGWANALPQTVKDSTFVQLYSHLTDVRANIGRGLRLGYERDLLGGHIAFAKRALRDANAGLLMLSAVRQRLPASDAAPYETLYELRNTLGLYVQDLRDRFALGTD